MITVNDTNYSVSKMCSGRHVSNEEDDVTAGASVESRSLMMQDEIFVYSLADRREWSAATTNVRAIVIRT